MSLNKEILKKKSKDSNAAQDMRRVEVNGTEGVKL